jgi:hypothetical protein
LGVSALIMTPAEHLHNRGNTRDNPRTSTRPVSTVREA